MKPILTKIVDKYFYSMKHIVMDLKIFAYLLVWN